MNSHWEELFGQVEELLTDNPDDYRIHIHAIIEYSSVGECDGEWQFEGLLRLHVMKRIKAMLSSVVPEPGASGYVSTLLDIRQRLVDKAEWISPYRDRLMNTCSIIDEVFEEVLSDHPDLRDAAEIQVSVLC